MVLDPHRKTLTIELDGKKVVLVPEIIEGYRLHVDGENIASFLSKTPPLQRTMATLEEEGSFGVGDLERASELKNWSASDAGTSDPAEDN